MPASMTFGRRDLFELVGEAGHYRLMSITCAATHSLNLWDLNLLNLTNHQVEQALISRATEVADANAARRADAPIPDASYPPESQSESFL